MKQAPAMDRKCAFWHFDTSLQTIHPQLCSRFGSCNLAWVILLLKSLNPYYHSRHWSGGRLCVARELLLRGAQPDQRPKIRTLLFRNQNEFPETPTPHDRNPN